jgi:hypothetical protein
MPHHGHHSGRQGRQDHQIGGRRHDGHGHGGHDGHYRHGRRTERAEHTGSRPSATVVVDAARPTSIAVPTRVTASGTTLQAAPSGVGAGCPKTGGTAECLGDCRSCPHRGL